MALSKNQRHKLKSVYGFKYKNYHQQDSVDGNSIYMDKIIY